MMSDEMVRSLVERTARVHQLPAIVVAIVRTTGATAIINAGVGVEACEVMTARDSIPLHSLSKPIIATAVLQLVGASGVDLSAPLSVYLTDAERDLHPRWAAATTVADLLLHTSGLSDFDTQSLATVGIYDLLRAASFRGEHGSRRTHYSNIGYDILGCLVQRVGGRSLASFLETHLFAPLQMRGTTIGTVPNGVRPVLGHVRSSVDGTVTALTLAATFANTVQARPSVGIRSTVNDVAAFLAWQLRSSVNDNADLLSHSKKRSMHEVFARSTTCGRSGMGLGFRVTYANCERVFCHGGGGRGFTNFLMGVPERQLGVIVSTNLGGAASAVAEIGTGILRIICTRGSRATFSEPGGDAFPKEASGRYRSTFWDIELDVTSVGRGAAITVRGGHASSATKTSTLRPVGPQRYLAAGGMFAGFEMHLDRDEAGRFSLTGGLYPFQFRHTVDSPGTTTDSTAHTIIGDWESQIRTPLGTTWARLVVSTHSVILTTQFFGPASLMNVSLSASSLIATFPARVTAVGCLEMLVRLSMEGCRLCGTVVARGDFGEFPMNVNFSRAEG